MSTAGAVDLRFIGLPRPQRTSFDFAQDDMVGARND